MNIFHAFLIVFASTTTGVTTWASAEDAPSHILDETNGDRKTAKQIEASVSTGDGIVVCGSSKFVGEKKWCPNLREDVDPNSLRAVRCCSDVDLGRRWQKNKGCIIYSASKVGVKAKARSAVSHLSGTDNGTDTHSPHSIFKSANTNRATRAMCRGKINLLEAQGFCKSAGSRLCTPDEVEMGCAENSGCSYNREMIWTALEDATDKSLPDTPPPIPNQDLNTSPSPTRKQGPSASPSLSYAIATCGSREGVGTTCTNHEEMISRSSLRAVRCCSDIDGGRRWKKNEGCNVWGASKLSSGTGNKSKCGGIMNFLQAKNFCESSGARLCASEEVANGCTEQTGCNYNREMVWTSSLDFETSVSPSITSSPTSSHTSTPSSSPSLSYAIAACGSSDFVGRSGCPSHEEQASRNSLKAVRCCSDNNLGKEWIRNTKIAECNVWAAAKNLLRDGGRCSEKLNFLQAQELCTSIGGRLCTSSEVSKDCTGGTGCKSNRKMIWTSSTDFTTSANPTSSASASPSHLPSTLMA